MILRRLVGVLQKQQATPIQSININCSLYSRFSTSCENYYKLLGVSKNSTQEEIKKAYYSLAQKFHPDVNSDKDAGQNFAKINNAYQILSDQQQRKEYDQSSQFKEDMFGQQYQRNTQSNTYEGYAQQRQNHTGRSGFSFHDFFQFDEEFLKSFFNNKSNSNSRQNNKENRDFSKFKNPKQNNQKYVYDEQEFEFMDEEDDFTEDYNKSKKQSKPFSKDKTKKGADIIQIVSISLNESLIGCTKVVNVEKKSVCVSCYGTRKEPGSKKKLCKSCKGCGNVQFKQGINLWEFPCEDCNGAGQILENPCKCCKATGIQSHIVKQTIHIPKGVNQGQTIKFPNLGNQSDKGGAPGDLVIRLKVQLDQKQNKTESEKSSDFTISPAKASLGGKIIVKTINGEVELTIPAGVQDGHKLKISGYGTNKDNNRGQSGDQFLTINIKIPQKLSQQEKQIYEQILKLEEGV